MFKCPLCVFSLGLVFLSHAYSSNSLMTCLTENVKSSGLIVREKPPQYAISENIDWLSIEQTYGKIPQDVREFILLVYQTDWSLITPICPYTVQTKKNSVPHTPLIDAQRDLRFSKACRKVSSDVPSMIPFAKQDDYIWFFEISLNSDNAYCIRCATQANADFDSQYSSENPTVDMKEWIQKMTYEEEGDEKSASIPDLCDAVVGCDQDDRD